MTMKIENNTGKTGLLKLYIDENGSKIFVRGSKDYGCFTLKNPVSYTHLDVYKRQVIQM